MLHGEHITLRPWREDDLTALGALRNDIDTQLALMSQPRPSSADRVRDWLAARAADEHCAFFVIARNDGEAACGFAEVRGIHAVHRRGMLGIALAPDARGRGFANEALDLLESYVVRVFDLHKIVLEVLADNAAGRALYARQGYREVGVLREHARMDGRFCDVVIMEKMLRTER